MNSRVRIAVIQHRLQLGAEQHIAALDAQIEAAALAGARLIVLPELHDSAYFCQTEDPSLFDLAQPLDGPSRQRLAALAKKHAVVIVGSLFEKRGSGVYHNTAIVLESDGSLAGHYRKMHIPDDPGFYEKYYFTPGDSEPGFEPIQTSVGRLGVLVCWDQWFPEAARLMALAGADMLIYPTAIGWDPEASDDTNEKELNAWLTIQRAHAIANHLPVIAANRGGHEASPAGGGIDFWGNSFVCGPQGEWLARKTDAESSELIADIDYRETDQLRRIWPYQRDRRIDAYGKITRRVIDQDN